MFRSFRQVVSKVVVVSIAVMLAAPVSAQNSALQVPVTSEFIPGEIQFTGGLGTVYQYRWTMVAVDGQLALCGAGYLRDGRLRSSINDMLEGASLLVGSQVVPVDARFFTRARSARRLDQAVATCQPTGVSANTRETIYFQPDSGSWRN
ncbi:hypothetical protein QTA57_09430 [Fontisubflavum oceani]|uniref:hypothetical protein n=1 Tax=Fontisubflavum oceani TaxID=2978973 RepID=UPI0025B515A5|nr:hypothetical protein [Fontisubflavum oceani]WJY20128.1 hypothetical protein QTA57_09430 [Fontisubflavum oceani]